VPITQRSTQAKHIEMSSAQLRLDLGDLLLAALDLDRIALSLLGDCVERSAVAVELGFLAGLSLFPALSRRHRHTRIKLQGRGKRVPSPRPRRAFVPLPRNGS